MMGSPYASIWTLPHKHRTVVPVFGVVDMPLLCPLLALASGNYCPHTRLPHTLELPRTPFVRSPTSQNSPSTHLGEYGFERARVRLLSFRRVLHGARYTRLQHI